MKKPSDPGVNEDAKEPTITEDTKPGNPSTHRLATRTERIFTTVQQYDELKVEEDDRKSFQKFLDGL